jgi:hypothetical protein
MQSDRELQKAASRDLCERLAARGDARTIVREIDHWAYFPTPESRASFVEAGIRAGFRLRGTSEPTGPWQGFGAQLYHRDVPIDEAMEQVTLLLYDLAEESGGDYDGWETLILA